MKTRINALVALALLFCFNLTRLFAQEPGQPDYSFEEASANGPVFAVGTTSGGYIWMGGYFNSVNGSQHNNNSYPVNTDSYFDLAVLNTNGYPDTSFQYPNYSGNFSSYFPGPLYYYYVSSIVIDTNDIVFVAFNSLQYGYSSIIARFDPSGPGSWTLNGGYTTASKNQFTVIYSMATDGSKLYVAGDYNSYNGSHYSGSLVPLDYSGGSNTSFTLPSQLSQYGTPYVYQVRYLSTNAGFTNNSLLVCGSFGVARMSTDGSTLISGVVNSAGNDGFACAAIRPDNAQLSCPDPAGEFLVGGGADPYSPYVDIYESRQFGGFQLARYGAETNNTLPVLDLKDEGNDDEWIARVDALPDGSMLISGWFNDINGTYVNNWAHLLLDGTVDENFDNNASLAVYDMAEQPDGKYVLGGAGFYTEATFGGLYGYVTRNFGISPNGPGPFEFTEQPDPTNTVVYPGDPIDIYASVSAPSSYSLQWTQDGTNLDGQTSSELYIYSATTNDAGTYALVASIDPLCPESITSSNAIVTVLTPPPPPTNDMFANAAILTGTNEIADDYIRGSTEEPGEPDHAYASDGHSVWYRWTAPGNGLATITISENDFPPALAVYTGTAVDDLTLVTNDSCSSGGEDALIIPDCTDGLTGTVTFYAVAGTTYQIAVGGQFETASLDTFELSLSEDVGAGGVGPGAGTTWQPVYTSGYSFYAVAAGCGEVVAGGYPPMMVTSPDTVNWTAVSVDFSSENSIYGISFGDGLFLAGTYGQIAVSRNPASQWNVDNPPPSNNYFYGSAYGNGLYVNAGAQGTLMSSPDGTNWTVEATNTAANTYDWLYAVTYHDGLFVAVGDDGSVVTSPDGTNWTLAASYVGYYSGDSLYSIAYGNGLFVAVGEDGSIVTSSDATNWTFQSSPASTADVELNGVTFGAGRFVAVGDSGTIFLSTDGVNWVKDLSGDTDEDLFGVTYYGGGRYVIVGDQGTILVNQLPSFKSITPVPSGGLQVTLLGLSGATAVIEATPSLSPANWQPILTNTFVNSTIIFDDPGTNQTRFFRALVH